MVRGPATEADTELQRSPVTLETLRSGIELIASPRVRRALLIALDDAKGDLEVAKSNIEGWFDASMQRVSGWYKRRTHYWLLLIGVLSSLALNVNTITIAQHLARSKAARELVVGSAGAVIADNATVAAVRGTASAPASVGEARDNLHLRLQALQSLDLPLGWDRVPAPGDAPVSWFLQQVVGLLLTTLAISLGAPFWFDALNKVMTVKTTGGSRKEKKD